MNNQLSERYMKQQLINSYIRRHRKSYAWVLLFSVALGPVGFLFVKPVYLFVYLVFALLFALVGAAPAAVILWPLSIIHGPILVYRENKKVEAEAELMA